jgi:hypothetical protein
LEQWFRDTWLNRDEASKIRVLDTLEEHPEEIFYLLVKDAMESPTKLSPAGIEKAYDFMSKVVQPENDQEPSEEEKKGPPGTGVLVPGTPGEEDEEKPGETEKAEEKPSGGTYKTVEPAIKETPAEETTEEPGIERFESPKKRKRPSTIPFSREKQRQIAKKLRPWLTRSSASNVLRAFLES